VHPFSEMLFPFSFPFAKRATIIVVLGRLSYTSISRAAIETKKYRLQNIYLASYEEGKREKDAKE